MLGQLYAGNLEARLRCERVDVFSNARAENSDFHEDDSYSSASSSSCCSTTFRLRMQELQDKRRSTQPAVEAAELHWLDTRGCPPEAILTCRRVLFGLADTCGNLSFISSHPVLAALTCSSIHHWITRSPWVSCTASGQLFDTTAVLGE